MNELIVTSDALLSHNQNRQRLSCCDHVLKVVGDRLDDIYDSARYGLYSFITAEEKPVAVRRAEGWQPSSRNGSPTARFLTQSVALL